MKTDADKQSVTTMGQQGCIKYLLNWFFFNGRNWAFANQAIINLEFAILESTFQISLHIDYSWKE